MLKLPLKHGNRLNPLSHKRVRRRRSVLLLEPDYANKYPPMGLMKLATYHRRQGWNVVFYKGDLGRFVAERIALRCMVELDTCIPGIRFGRFFPEIVQYIWKKNDKPIKGCVEGLNSGFLACMRLLYEYRHVYERGEYFSWKEWDRVLVTTLFTFYADKTIETIRFAKRLVPNDRIMVGGVMASVVPNYIEEQTGVKPCIGLLDARAIMGDKPLDCDVDDLPLDYSILEEIDYAYPASNAFFAHTTRGCVNRCPFCAVPTLEPEYQEFRPLLKKLSWERKMFGNKSNLLLLDNNVFASKAFPRIVDEIKSCGFTPGARVSITDPLELCRKRLSDRHPYNERAWIRKAVLCIQKFRDGIRDQEERSVVTEALAVAHAERDWHGTTKVEVIGLIDKVLPLWHKVHKDSWRQAVVDFNQGLDSRLSTEPEIMKKLAEIPVRPVRIAFDHWNLRNKYEQSITAAANAGLTHMSNYILYNFQDYPEELYWRLRLNIALCEELGVNIYSFPMKYHPIRDPEWFSNRNYIGLHWCRKYIRFVQTVLIPTMGKIGVGKTFFLKAFGTTTDEFRELLLMPEYMIRERWDCEIGGMTQRWRDSLYALSPEEQLIVRKYISDERHKIPEAWQKESNRIQDFLHFYLLGENDIHRPTDSERNKAKATFEDMWRNVDVRICEKELAVEKKKTKKWVFGITNPE